MILGIFDADVLPGDLQPQYFSYGHMVINLFRQVDRECQFKVYSAVNHEYPDHHDECDAYLITGSKNSSYDEDDWIKGLKNVIQKLYLQRKKLLGICFGHQLIAYALGGRTELARQGWGIGVHGYQTTEIAQQELNFLPNSFSLLASHRDQVIKLPEGAQLVAHSRFCANAAYQIKSRVLCFQGHPEFVPEYADALMRRRKFIIPNDIFKDAQKSLSHPTHHLAVAKCMMGFIEKENSSE